MCGCFKHMCATGCDSTCKPGLSPSTTTTLILSSPMHPRHWLCLPLPSLTCPQGSAASRLFDHISWHVPYRATLPFRADHIIQTSAIGHTQSRCVHRTGDAPTAQCPASGFLTARIQASVWAMKAPLHSMHHHHHHHHHSSSSSSSPSPSSHGAWALGPRCCS